MLPEIRGRVWKFGDDVDTDQILPSVYLSISDPQELSKHCMEGIEPGFAGKIAKGDVIVAGKNFGCGSSREHAPIALKTCGVSAIIAESFARIFFRNAINIGLPVLESPQAAREIQAGHEVNINVQEGLITDLATGRVYKATTYPLVVASIISAGGLVEYVRRELANRSG